MLQPLQLGVWGEGIVRSIAATCRRYRAYDSSLNSNFWNSSTSVYCDDIVVAESVIFCDDLFVVAIVLVFATIFLRRYVYRRYSRFNNDDTICRR